MPKIGVILAVDGEQQFRAAMRDAASAATAAKAEMAALKQQFSENANSMQALTAKQEGLISAEKALANVTKAAKAGRDNAQQSVDKYTQSVEKQKAKVAAAEAALEKAKQTYGENSSEVQKEETALKDMNRELEEQEGYLRAAENGLNKWRKKVADAEKAEDKNSKALKENEKYLDEAKSSADGCATSIDKFGKKTKEATKITTDWSEKLKMAAANKAMDIAAAGASAAVQAVKDGAKAAVEVGSNFEAAMSKVSALSGATGSNLDKLSAKAKQLGSSTRFSATEVAEGFQYMSLAGWDANTSLSAIDGVVQLAASSEMDLAEASDMVTDYLSAFGEESSKAGQMADMLAYAQANSNTTAAQLGEAYGNCAAGLHSAGQEMDTVTAILEGMANNGLKGSEAGTALNSVMSQITQKMKDGAIQIGETSVAVQDQDGNFRDLIDIMEDVEAATDGMGTAERSAALAAVFNRTSLVGVNQILNEGTGKIRKYRDELNQSAGAAEDMADVMQDNLQGDITTLNSALEGLGIAAYEQVSGPVRGVVQGVTDVVSHLTEAITPAESMLKSFADSIRESARATRETVENAHQTVSDAELSSAQLETYKQILIESNGAADEFAKYRVKEIVDELADKVPELAAAWDEETQSLKLSNEEISSLIDNSAEMIKVQAYHEAAQTAIEAQVQAEIDLAKAQAARSEAEKQYNQDAETVVGHVQQMTVKSREATDALYAAKDAEKEAEKALEAANKEVDYTKTALDKMGHSLDETTDSEEEAADASEELAAAVDEIDTEALEELQKEADNAKTSIVNAMKGAVSAFDEFNGGAEVTKEEVIKNLDSQIEGLENWSSNMEKLGAEAGEGMSQELYDYLAEMGPQSANLVQTLVDALENDTDSFSEISEKWAKALELSDNADQIASATSAAKAVAEAYATGLEEGQQGIVSSMDADTAAAVKAISEKAGEFQTGGAESIRKMASGMTSASGAVRTAGSNAASSGKSGASGQYSGYYSTGSNLAGGIAGGIRAGSGKIESAARTAARNAYNAAKRELDIKSPSRKTRDQIGKPFSEGVAKGIADGASGVATSAVAMVNSAATKAKDAAKKGGQAAYYEAKSWIDEYNALQKDEAAKNAAADTAEDKALQKRIAKNFGVKDTKTVGSGKKEKTVKKSASEYSADILEAAETYLGNFAALNDISEKQELKYWQGVQKRLKKGSQAWYDAQKKINELSKSIDEEQLKTAEDTVRDFEEKQEAKAQKILENRKTLANVQNEILADYKVYYQTSSKAEAQYWNEARKKFKKGTQERIDADQKYLEARKAYLAELEELNQDYKDRKAEIDNELKEQTEELKNSETEKIKEIEDAYTDAIKNRKQAILSSQNLFEAWDATGYTADRLIYNLKTQTEGLKLWEQEMNTLREKALPQEFVEQLEEMGPDATASIYSLNRMTQKQLDEYIAMWREKNEIAQRQAEAENEDLLKERDESIARVQADTAAQIESITNESNEQLKALKEEYKKNFKEINTGASEELMKLVKKSKKTGEDAVTELIAGLEAKAEKAKKKGKNVGKKVGEGIAEGIKDAIKDAEKAAEEIIDKTKKSAKKKAKIKSPSELFRDEVGAQIAAGIALGMSDEAGKVEASAKDMVDAAARAAQSPLEGIDWISQGMSGIRALNALTEPQAGVRTGYDDSGIVSVLNTLVQLVGAISEKDQQIVLDSGELVGSLTPGISREMAAASIRSTRGKLT